MKRIKINVLVVTMLVLCAALSMGCLEEKQTYVQEMNEKYDEQYDDEKFLEWLSEYLDEDTTIAEEQIRAAEACDAEGMSICGMNQQVLSIRGLNEINDFRVSPELRLCVREFERYMADSYMQGVYMESGWRDLNFDDIDLGIEYGVKAITHLERAIDGNK